MKWWKCTTFPADWRIFQDYHLQSKSQNTTFTKTEDILNKWNYRKIIISNPPCWCTQFKQFPQNKCITAELGREENGIPKTSDKQQAHMNSSYYLFWTPSIILVFWKTHSAEVVDRHHLLNFRNVAFFENTKMKGKVQAPINPQAYHMSITTL